MTIELRPALVELADSPAPPTTIDPARARVDGRRRIRRRRFTAAGSAAALLLGIALVPVVWPEREPRAPTTGPEPSAAASAASAASTPPASAPPTIGPPPPIGTGGRAPLVAEAAFGWLPGAFIGVGYFARFDGSSVVARGAGIPARVAWLPPEVPMIWLHLYPNGETPPLALGGSPEFKVPAPPVNGREAYWATSNRADPLNAGGGIYFRWKVAANRWAQIQLSRLVDADLQGVVHRIAREVRVGDYDVPLPFYVTGGLPAEFTMYQITLDRPAIEKGPWNLALIYTGQGTTVGIAVIPDPTAADGRQGNCVTANGVRLCIELPNVTAPALEAIGGVAGLLDRITVLGADESTWTTEVFR
jgi:hypothetical protein